MFFERKRPSELIFSDGVTMVHIVIQAMTLSCSEPLEKLKFVMQKFFNSGYNANLMEIITGQSILNKAIAVGWSEG